MDKSIEIIEKIKTHFNNIGSRIREITKETKKYTLDEMPNAISRIKEQADNVGTVKTKITTKKIIERKDTKITELDLYQLESIGDYSLANYENLEELSVPNSVRKVGYSALKNCNNLKKLSIPFVGTHKNNDTSTNFGYIFGATDRYENGDYVPTSLKEVKITGETPIGDGAFFDCKDITEVDMKESLIKDIGILAFYGCTALENVTLPNTIENVGLGAFYGNDNLNYTIVDGIKYLGNDDNPYLYCEGDRLNLTRTSINIQEGCKIIGAGAFLGCVLVSSLSIPSSVEYIGDYAFRSCSRLSNVYFGGNSKLKRIGRESFRDCKGVLGMGGLTSITLPNSVEFIDRGAFRGCDKLTSITLPFVGRTRNPNERHSHFGYIFGANSYEDNGTYVPQGLNVVVTDAICIGAGAFKNCTFNNLLLNGEIEYIGNGAFGGLDCPFQNFNGVYYICATGSAGSPLVCMGNLSGYAADYDIIGGCKFIYALKDTMGDNFIVKLSIPNSVIGISDNLLNNKIISFRMPNIYKPTETSIETYYLGNEENPYLYCIGCEAKDNYNGESIVIAEGCRFIGEQAFMGLQRARVVIPKSVKYIGASAFENAYIELLPQEGTTFEEYEFTKIGNYAFYNSQTDELISNNSPVLQATIKHIGKGAFKYSSRHEDTTLKGTETIGDSAFANFVMPDNFDLSQTNITSLPNYMFADCQNAKAIILPNTLERIGNSAFENVTIMSESITIPKNVISIDDNAFKNCKINGDVWYNPRKVYFDGTIDHWATIEFGNSHSSPIRHGVQGADITLYVLKGSDYSSVREDVVLDKAYKISDYAFFDYRQITSITIPDTTTSIGESAFENSWITSVKVGENTLFDFTKLALGGLSDYITLDEDVGKIKDYAFYNNKLTEFTIPSGCKAIGKKAFNCTSGQTPTLKTIYVKAETPPTLSDSATFPSSVSKYVIPKGKLSAYKSATNWATYSAKMVEEE